MYSAAHPAWCITKQRFLALVRKHRPWFVPREAAAYLHVSIRTLESWRALGTGSAFTKRKNGFIRYHIDGVDAFMAADPH